MSHTDSEERVDYVTLAFDLDISTKCVLYKWHLKDEMFSRSLKIVRKLFVSHV